MSGRDFRQDRWRDVHTRSAVGVDATGEILAAGMIWTSRVHGAAYSVDVAVRPSLQRSGLGTAMIRHLSTLRFADLPFMMGGHPGDPSLAFADALGARTIQVVPPSIVDTIDGRGLRPFGIVQPVGLVHAAAVEAANAEIYRWTHASWYPVSPTFASALNEDLWDELDSDASSVALDDSGRILAAALVYLDSEPPVMTAESVEPDHPDAERHVEACIRRSLSRLADRGVAKAVFDGHVTDTHFMSVLARLNPSGRWFRIVKIPAALAEP